MADALRARGAAYARFSFEDVIWVGADEMNRRKGHNYLTVFADLVNRRVVSATLGKDASTWKRLRQNCIRTMNTVGS